MANCVRCVAVFYRGMRRKASSLVVSATQMIIYPSRRQELYRLRKNPVLYRGTTVAVQLRRGSRAPIQSPALKRRIERSDFFRQHRSVASSCLQPRAFPQPVEPCPDKKNRYRADPRSSPHSRDSRGCGNTIRLVLRNPESRCFQRSPNAWLPVCPAVMALK